MRATVLPSLLSIRLVADRTGIPAQTLRVWERRYGFPNPVRRVNGERVYADSDVAQLRLIARARDLGYRPSDLVTLSKSDLEAIVGATGQIEATRVSVGDDAGSTVDTLIEHLQASAVVPLRSALHALSRSLGPRRFVVEVAAPFLARVGEGWRERAIAIHQERLASTLLALELRRLLFLFEDCERPPTVLLATLPGELHTLGLEMVSVYLASGGATARLLGAETPPREIAAAAQAMNADAIGISVSGASVDGARRSSRARREVHELARALPPNVELWFGGAGAAHIASASRRAQHIPSWASLDAAVAQRASGGPVRARRRPDGGGGPVSR